MRTVSQRPSYGVNIYQFVEAVKLLFKEGQMTKVIADPGEVMGCTGQGKGQAAVLSWPLQTVDPKCLHL